MARREYWFGAVAAACAAGVYGWTKREAIRGAVEDARMKALDLLIGDTPVVANVDAYLPTCAIRFGDTKRALVKDVDIAMADQALIRGGSDRRRDR